VLLILLTISLLVVAVVECLWEARRLSRRDRGLDDDDFIFPRRRRRDRKPKEGGGNGKGGGSEMDDKYRASGALYAPKLQDVPVSETFFFFLVYRVVDRVLGFRLLPGTRI